MVCGFDLHRGQITFDALEVESGEVRRDRVGQPDRARFGRWPRDDLAPRAHGQPVAVAVEGCTGWRYVVEEIRRRRFRGASGRAGRYPKQPGAASHTPRQTAPTPACCRTCWWLAICRDRKSTR